MNEKDRRVGAKTNQKKQNNFGVKKGNGLNTIEILKR